MRVLFVSNFYPPHDLGGWEQNCQEIAEGFRARGHTCHVLTSRYGLDAHPHSEEGVTRSLYLQADIHYYRPLGFFLRRSKQEQANREQLRQTINSFCPDVVFIWGMWNLSHQVAYWAEQWMPGRVAYSVASYWPMEPDAHEAYWQRSAQRPWVQMVMAPARHLALRQLAQQKTAHPLKLEHVACVSEYVRRKLATAGALPNDGCVIYNGIDPRPFMEAAGAWTPRPNELRLVYTGGILAHKGVHTAVEALGLMQHQSEAKGMHLTLVGGGHPDYEAQLKQRIEQLGLSQHVTFRGRVPRPEIPVILAQHDVFLFPSIWEEPIARTVMEAMAAGLAVIGTPVGGQAEMLEDGVNALVFPPDDASWLAECILKLQCDTALRIRLAEAGQNMVLKRFTMERMVDEMEAWLREMVK